MIGTIGHCTRVDTMFFHKELREETGTTAQDDENGLQVIGVGLFRTGTMSLKLALETLYPGQKCYHMIEILQKQPKHIEKWIRIANRYSHHIMRPQPPSLKREEWDQMFQEYFATTDVPTCFFYEQLMHIYPKAKFVLTTRDLEDWIRSVRATVLNTQLQRAHKSWSCRMFRFFTGRLDLDFMVERHTKLGLNLDSVEDDQALLKAHRLHIDRVRSTIPRDRLLVFDPSEGWDPLCKFLSREKPSVAYPHVNTCQEISGRMKREVMQAKIFSSLFVLAIVVVVASAVTLIGIAIS